LIEVRSVIDGKLVKGSLSEAIDPAVSSVSGPVFFSSEKESHNGTAHTGKRPLSLLSNSGVCRG
jgi:hypothetical protein